MKIKQLKQNGLTFVPQTVSEAVLVKVGDEVLTLKHLLNFGNPELVLVSTGGIPKWENQSSINAGKLGGLSVDELLLPAFAKFNIEDETITADTLLDSIKFTGTNILISAQDKTINFAIPEMKDGVLGLVKGTNNTDLFLKGDGSWATPINTWRSIIVGNNQLRGDINTGSLFIEAGKNTQIDLSDNILTISSTDTNTEYLSGEGLTLGDDNTFILNTADANNIGGILLGYQSSKKNYAVQVDNRKAFVNVPWDVNLHVGSVDFKRKTTENGETYISVSEDGQFKNKYLIKGDGGTTVSSDSNGNITINSLPLHWTNLDGVPEDFIPSEHSHYTDLITRLEGYKKAETDSDLLVYDTLNLALGKLEYKAHLGYEAYNWYKAVTKDDIDESVNKWGEIVEFLNSMEEGSDILDMFVTRLTNQNVTGSKIFTEPLSFKKGFTVGTSDLVENLNSELLGGYSASTLFSKLESTDTGYLSLSIGNTEKSVQLKKAIASNTLAGGNAGNIVYLSATGKTAFLENPSSGSVLKFNGEVPEWGLDYYRPIAVDDSIILGNNNNIFNLKQGSNITLDVKETDSKDYNVTINSYYHDTLYNISGGISEGGYLLTLTSSENVITDLVIPIMKGWDDPMAGLVPTPTSENTFLKSDGTWDIPINTWRKIIVGDKYLDNSISSGDLTIQAGANTQINLNSNILTISSSYVDTLYDAGIGLSLNGNTFDLLPATNDALGGILLGYTTADDRYAVLTDANKAYVKIPIRTSLEIKNVDSIPVITLNELGNVRGEFPIIGSGSTKVTYDEKGLNIFSKDIDTTYKAGTGLELDTKENIFNLNTAGENTLGGIRLGYSQEDKKYPIKLNPDNRAYVEVPWSIRLGISANSLKPEVLLFEGEVPKNKYSIVGSGSTTVSSDEDGNITIFSSDTNTTYKSGIGLNLNTADNTFNLLIAESDSLGGIKIGYTSTNTTYAVNLDNDNNAYVEVPVRTSLSIAKNATNPLIGLIEAGSIINLYNITGVGATTVSTDGNGDITISSHDTLYDLTGGIGTEGYQITLKSSKDDTDELLVPLMKGGKNPIAGLVPAPTSGDTFLKSDGTWDTPINTWRGITVKDSGTLGNSNISGDLTIIAGLNTLIELVKNTLTISSTDTNTIYKRGEGLLLDTDNAFHLLAAGSDHLGGIKVGYSSDDNNYAVKLDINNNAYVYVPPRTKLSVEEDAVITLTSAGATSSCKIVGDGNINVSTTKDGYINIYSPTTLDWKNITNYPDFAPAIHSHTTDVIKVLNYSNVEDESSIENNNTLNTALGKLDYKSSLGVLAYKWYKSVTGEDTDKLINKWEEIVSFLNGVKEEDNILDLFVTTGTALTISSTKTFSIAPLFDKGFTTSSKDIITNLNAEYFGGFTTLSLFSSLTNDNYSLSITIGNKTETIDALLAYSANTIDGYHISVGKSAGTDPNTIYFVI